MQINILIFGQLCEIIGEHIVFNDIADTDKLRAALNKKFPVLEDSKFMMAVNKKLVTENILLPANCTVAVLPPFSGG